jgi:hypothetical protein
MVTKATTTIMQQTKATKRTGVNKYGTNFLADFNQM